MTNSNKFNIRITFPTKQQEIEEPINNNDAVDHVYHWPRIIAVALLIITTLTTLVYYQYSSSNQSEVPLLVSNTETSTDTTKNKLPEEMTKADEMLTPVLDKQTQIKTVDEKNILDNDQSADETTAIAANIEEIKEATDKQDLNTNELAAKDVMTTEDQTENIEVTPDNQDLIDELLEKDLTTSAGNVENITEITGTQNVIANEQSEQDLITAENQAEHIDQATDISNMVTSEESSQHNDQSPVFSKSEIQIFSPQIKRFVIANKVQDKEPVGQIDDIQFDKNNIATVYAYSDVVGLSDQFIYYNWRLNGNQVARVEVGVWGNRWRSYSRKYIQHNKHGDWVVTLENKNGEILASSKFKY